MLIHIPQQPNIEFTQLFVVPWFMFDQKRDMAAETPATPFEYITGQKKNFSYYCL
jgi:hypothetical protein